MRSGLDGVHRGLVSAFGIALGSTILEYLTLAHLIGLGEGHEVSTLSVRETAADVAQLLTRTGKVGRAVGGKTLAVLRDHRLQRAELTAHQDPFLLLCVVTVMALLPALLSQASRKSSTIQIK
jgi:hypothetical protein